MFSSLGNSRFEAALEIGDSKEVDDLHAFNCSKTIMNGTLQNEFLINGLQIVYLIYGQGVY